MKRKNNEIAVHKCIFEKQAKNICTAIKLITEKDSLSVGDTQAIRILTETYDALTNPVQENRGLYRATDNNGQCEVPREQWAEIEQIEYFKWRAEIYRDRILTLSKDMEALKEELGILKNATCKVTGEPQLSFLKRETEICENKVTYRSEKIAELNKELEVIESINKKMEEENKSVDLNTCIDNTIESICLKIQKIDMPIEDYADTVKALAELIVARAKTFSRKVFHIRSYNTYICFPQSHMHCRKH